MNDLVTTKAINNMTVSIIKIKLVAIPRMVSYDFKASVTGVVNSYFWMPEKISPMRTLVQS